MSNHPADQPSAIYNQRGQYVYGPQTNIVGDQHIHSPRPEPTRAIPPSPPRDFVGRTDQLTQLTATLTAGHSAAITALQGMGGIGKTALAQQLAEQLKPDFLGGIFWGDLALHGGSAETILRAWGAICGADFSQEPDPAVLSERLRGLLTMRRETQGALLAVLDDVRSEWLPAAQLLQKSLPTGTPLLVTMRDVDLAIALDAEVVRLDVLPEADAHDLLAARVKPKEILTPEATVKTLLHHLGYLPLAIRLAAGHVSKFAAKPGFDLAIFVDDVAQHAISLLDAPNGSGLAPIFAISYAALNVEQQRVFRYCSVYSPALLTIEHMAGLLECEPATIEAALDELVLVALLDWDRETQGRYVLHPLLRQYGYKQMWEAEDMRTIHKRAAEYLHALETQRSRTPEEGLEEVDQWEKAGDWRAMALSASALVGGLSRLGYWDEIDQCLKRAQTKIVKLNDIQELTALLWDKRSEIALKQTRWEDAISYAQLLLQICIQWNNIRGQARAIHIFGHVYGKRGDWASATDTFQQALKLFEQIGDVEGIAGSLGNLGLICKLNEEWEDAISLYNQALEMFNQIKDVRKIAQIKGNLGNVFAQTGEWDKAINLIQQSLDVFEQLADLESIAISLTNLGDIYQKKKAWERAIYFYQNSLKVAGYVGDIHTQAGTYVNLGNVYKANKELDKAVDCYLHALNIFEHVNDTRKGATAASYLGSVFEEKYEWDKALDYNQRALQFHEGNDNLYGMAQMYRAIGNVCKVKGDWATAINYYNQASELFKQLNRFSERGNVFLDLNNIYCKKGLLDKAIDFCQQALNIFNSIDDMHGIAKASGNLGMVYQIMNEWQQALSFHERALHLFEELGETIDIAKTHNSLGVIYEAKGEWDNAIDFYQKSLRGKQSVGDFLGLARTYMNLGNIYSSKEDWEQATNYYQQSQSIFEQANDSYGLAQLYGNLGSFYYQQRNSGQTISYLRRAYQIFVQLGAISEAQKVEKWLVNILNSEGRVNVHLTQVVNGETSKTQDDAKKWSALEMLLAQVAQARRGDHTLGERLYPDFLSLSVDTQLSPEMQTLYKVLVRILAGINNPDLSALPVEWAEAVQTVIKQLQK